MHTLSALVLSFLLPTAAVAQSPTGQKPPTGQTPPAGQTPPPGQTPAGQKPPAGQTAPGQTATGQTAPGGAAQAPPSIGRAYGKVTDSTGQPMAQVSALLLKSIVDPATKKKKLVLI